MPAFALLKSDNPDKKFMVMYIDINKKYQKIYFGDSDYEDFTISKDTDRKLLYLNRHRKNENWDDIYSAGFWARHLLWNKPTIQKSIADVVKKFHIEIIDLIN
jgi:hypothetical protein